MVMFSCYGHVGVLSFSALDLGGGILPLEDRARFSVDRSILRVGMVVHFSSGVSALVAAYAIGPRLGYRHEPMPPHNLTYTALGAAMCG